MCTGSLSTRLCWDTIRTCATLPSAATRVAYNEAAALEFDESWQRASSIPGPPAALLTNPTSRFFADLISQDSFSSEILLTDRFGRLVAASGQTSDYVQADEDWWTRAFGDGIRGRLFVSGVGYDESAQTEAIAIAVPVTTEDSVVGVIKVITDIRAITTLVSGMRIGVTGNATLVRPNGSIVLSGAGPSAPPADFFASGVLRERLGDVPSGTLSQLSFSAPATNGEMRLVGGGVEPARGRAIQASTGWSPCRKRKTSCLGRSMHTPNGCSSCLLSRRLPCSSWRSSSLGSSPPRQSPTTPTCRHIRRSLATDWTWGRVGGRRSWSRSRLRRAGRPPS